MISNTLAFEELKDAIFLHDLMQEFITVHNRYASTLFATDFEKGPKPHNAQPIHFGQRNKSAATFMIRSI